MAEGRGRLRAASRSELDRLGDVSGFDPRGALQVGLGAGLLEDAVTSPG